MVETQEGSSPHRRRHAGVCLSLESYTAPKHTVLNFPVDDVEAAVDELNRRGVAMEQYDLPAIKTDERGSSGATAGRARAPSHGSRTPADHVLSVLEVE